MIGELPLCAGNLHLRFHKIASRYYNEQNVIRNARSTAEIMGNPNQVDQFMCLYLTPDDVIGVNVKPLQTVNNASTQGYFSITEAFVEIDALPQLCHKTFPCCCSMPILSEFSVCPCPGICKYGEQNVQLVEVDVLPVEQNIRNHVDEDEVDAHFDDPELESKDVEVLSKRKRVQTCSACGVEGHRKGSKKCLKEKEGSHLKKKKAHKIVDESSDSSDEDEMSESASEETFEVERIVDDKMEGRSHLFLLKWKGYSDNHNEWTPASRIKDKEMMKIYLNNKPNRPNAGIIHPVPLAVEHAPLIPVSLAVPGLPAPMAVSLAVPAPMADVDMESAIDVHGRGIRKRKPAPHDPNIIRYK